MIWNNVLALAVLKILKLQKKSDVTKPLLLLNFQKYLIVLLKYV